MATQKLSEKQSKAPGADKKQLLIFEVTKAIPEVFLEWSSSQPE